jgi:hypothetical protein
MSRHRTLLALSTVAFCAQTIAAAPQQTPTSATTISRDVVAVLLQGPDVAPGEAFDLRMGAAPAGFPADLLPTGTRVAATATTSKATTVVGTLARFAQADRPAFESSLARSGWIDEEARPRGLNATAQGTPIVVCRGADFATVTFTPREPTGTFVRASIVKDETRRCAARPVSTFGDVPMPSLRPPSGAESSGAGIGGNSNAMYSSVRLRTAQPVETIASHYASQLTAAGWKVEGHTAEEKSIAVTRLSGSSTTGEPLSGMLVVTSLASADQVDVLLRVVRNSRN